MVPGPLFAGHNQLNPGANKLSDHLTDSNHHFRALFLVHASMACSIICALKVSLLDLVNSIRLRCRYYFL